MLTKLLKSAFSRRASATPLIERGLALYDGGDLDAAERVLGEAVARHPHNTAAVTNLALVYIAQGKAPEAIRTLERALAIDPRCAPAHTNYAYILRASGKLEDAIKHYRAAIAFDPDFAGAGQELLHTLLEVCDWQGADAMAGALRDRIACTRSVEWMPFVSPLTAIYLGLDAERCKAVAAFHANMHVRQGTTLGPQPVRARGPDERLKLGYFSRDFRKHAVGRVLHSVFGLHDRGRFEVHAFSFGADDGSVYRDAIASSVDRFVDVYAMSDDAAARAIADCEIDVLVDLMGHTSGSRLGVLARRPAPVQAHYLGYPGTTGASYIDYFIGDAVVTPPALQNQFTERLVRVNACFMVTDGAEASDLRRIARAEQKLPEDAFVFSNFSTASRIDRGSFELWMQILDAAPASVLWLARANPIVVETLRREARARGVDDARLIFAERVADKAAHLSRLGCSDLALDTIGWYNGHSTTADMLWAGVPVLTAPGATFASRVAASLVGAAGSRELVVETPEDYVASAVALAAERARTRRLHAALSDARASAPFFDTPQLVRDLESAFETMYADKMRALPAGL